MCRDVCMHLLSLRVTIKVSGRKVTHHFHQKGTFELACEVRICRRGPRKMILVMSRVPYIHICFVVIWTLLWTCSQVLPHTPWPLQTRCFGSTCRPMDHIDSMSDSRCDSIGQHRTAPDSTGHDRTPNRTLRTDGSIELSNLDRTSPDTTGHSPDSYRTVSDTTIGQQSDSRPDIHRTFTGHDRT